MFAYEKVPVRGAESESGSWFGYESARITGFALPGSKTGYGSAFWVWVLGFGFGFA